MSDFFNNVLNNPGSLSKDFLGQDYKYHRHIRNPGELNMSGEGTMDAIGNDVNGIINYVQLLVSGGGIATKDAPDGILGDRFFLKTGGQCVDLKTKNKVDRYIYINNVPDGSIPFISASMGGYKMKSLRGIVPGIMTNIGNIEPTKIFGAFMMGGEPKCMEVTRNVIDENGVSRTTSRHMIRPDIMSSDDTIHNVEDDLKKFDSYGAEGLTMMSQKANGVRGRAKKPYVPRRAFGAILPYGPDRPYYPSTQPAYHSPYLKERPYQSRIERPPLPEYVMPVAIVPDFKLCEKEVEERKEDVIYAPDITHKKDVSTVPQIKEVNIINIDTHTAADDAEKADYSNMPDDVFLKIYYSSLGLLGLYIFLKMLEKKKGV
jgi:hypothetical protein